MVDIYSIIQALLTTSELGLPVYHEYFTKTPTVPCISWFLINSYTDKRGDTMEFDDVYLRVTVWGTTLDGTFYDDVVTVDNLLQSNGLLRYNSQDIFTDDGLFKRVMSYSCKTLLKEN